MHHRHHPLLPALAVLALLAMPGGAAAAGLPHLVADLDPRVPGPGDPFRSTDLGADPAGWFAFGQRAFFTASTESTGREPWITDGTPTGTRQLADLCPGRCDASVRPLGAARGVFFFLAAGPGGGTLDRIWRTDGTAAGTFELAALASGDPLLTSAGLWFGGRSAGAGVEPWKSDGTPAGTGPIADLEPGVGDSSPVLFTVAGKRVLFASGSGSRVWSTNGTASGTVMLLETNLQVALAAERRTFFISRWVGGPELWETDGTVAGTRRISSLPGTVPLGTTLSPAGDGVLFVADDPIAGRELYRGDTTGIYRVSDTSSGPLAFAAAGTRVVYTAWQQDTVRLFASDGRHLGAPLTSCGAACPEVRFETRLTSLGATVFLAASDPAHGIEPWVTDGTAPGTRRLADVCPGPCDAHLGAVIVAGSRAFFAAGRSFSTNVELWTTDGTPGGTRRISDFIVDDAFAEFEQPHALSGAWTGSRFFFGAAHPDWGLQPWVTDGTRAGTRLVTVIGASGAGSSPFDVSPLTGGIGFAACDGEIVRLYVSDGSAEGTRIVATPDPAPTCGDGLHSYRVVSRGNGNQLFFVDGDTLATRLNRVRVDGSGREELVVVEGFHAPTHLVPWGAAGVAYFLQSHSLSEHVLVTSDGTAAGTDVVPMPAGLSHPSSLTAVGGRIFWSGLVPQGQDGLFTLEGGEAVRLGPPGSGFVAHAGAVFFSGPGGLWRTDGTPAGTALVWTPPGPSGSFGQIRGLVAYAGNLYLFALTADASAYALWRSDGTSSGTTMVAAVPSAVGINPDSLVATPAGLFFVSTHPTLGRELWTSDGTAGGTRLVLDLAAGPASSFPENLTSAGGALLFTADDGPHGFELWSSDGTAAGTRMVLDIAPGHLSSYPDQLTVSAGQLFFTAADGLHGREPWALPLASAPGCTPSATRLCLLGGRYAVEARWRDHDGNSGTGKAHPLAADTGAFWFFDAGNLEVAVKVLDGTVVNGHRWVFYGALSNVEYTLTVTDTATGAVRRYLNPAGVQASVGDTEGFGPGGATGAPLVARTAAAALERTSRPGVSAVGSPSCVADDVTLCLAEGRFAVTVRWEANGGSGPGRAVPVVADTGAFWFFGPSNLELLVKVLDGRALNDSWWVFFGALSNVAYTVTVTDTVTGQQQEYRNPAGHFGSVADTDAFPD